MQYIEPEGLSRFFNGLRGANLFIDEFIVGFDDCNLKNLFEASHASIPDMPPHQDEYVKSINISADELRVFLAKLTPEIEDLRSRGTFCNPWKVASLKRHEVRNTAVLAWLLDPQGDHGLSGLLLNALLRWVNKRHPHIPSAHTEAVRVMTEVNPENDQSDRVDIEIVSDQFYLLVEVKIDAFEGEDQLHRYGESCGKVAANRPWVIVYLTPCGKRPTTAGKHAERVFCISWKSLANTLMRALNKSMVGGSENDFNVRLVALYLRHVRNF